MREIKVRLSTVIYIFIIIVLILALGTVYYIGFEKNRNLEENSNIIGNENTSGNLEENSNSIGNKNISEVPVTDLVAVSSMQGEEDKLFFAYIEDGKVYYFYKSDVWLLGQYEYDEKMKVYDGIDNAKRIKMYNLGTGILPTVYVITEDGKVYTGRLIYDNFRLELDNRLAEYEIEDILNKTGEMQDVFELLLKDGTTKTVTFEL